MKNEWHSLSDIFLNAVQKWPHHVALECDGRHLTYIELYHLVMQYAFKINQATYQLDKQQCIAIYGTKSLETVAVILAALITNHAFMPLDLTWPATRIAAALKMAKPKLLITTGLNLYLKKQLENIFEMPVHINLEQLNETVLDIESQSLPSPQGGEQIAYVLFTSGSTGTPKGVCMSHRAILAALQMMFEHISFDQQHRIINQSAFCYDLAIFDLFTAFYHGALVHLLLPETVKVPQHFIDYIAQNRLNSLYIVSSSLEYILKFVSQSTVSLPIKTLLLTGDMVSNNLINLLKACLPHDANIWNLYSAVEMPYAFTQKISLENPIYFKTFNCVGSKINYSLANIEKGISNRGELVIKSTVLFSGYLTENVLLQELQKNPCQQYHTGDGVEIKEDSIELLGRIDRQVKILGNRIELDEIEIILETLPSIQEVAVCADKSKELIIAFIVLKEDYQEDLEQLKQLCHTTFPTIMKPQKVIIINKMPRTTSGKKDRKILYHNYLEQNYDHVSSF